jgi:very-short-patch-repair endonuclease
VRVVKSNPFANKLRRDQPDAERQLWMRLRNRQLEGHKFRRQHPIPPYIADFVCIEKALIVELDGGQHLEFAKKDEARTRFLESKGYRVIRFWNNEVLTQTDAVLEVILAKLDAPHPALSPPRGARVETKGSKE